MLGTLRSWLSGLFGGTDADDRDGDADGGGGDGEPSGLDPDNVTEVRTEADEDPIERLREIQRERPDGTEPDAGDDAAPGDADGSGGPDGRP